MVGLMKIIEFKSAIEFERGTIYNLLCEGYAALLEVKPGFVDEYKMSWKKADDDIFDCPDTIGRCILISTINEEPIGLVSWDPRKVPDEGMVGQNCILPSWRGKGYGKQQIRKVMEIFKSQGTRVIKVITDNHPFFIPARKTYLSCGFRETGRSYGDLYGGLELIHFETVMP